MRASLSFADTSRNPQPITVDLLKIMHNTEEITLRIYLALSPQGEPIEPDDRSDMGEGRLANRQRGTDKIAAPCQR